MFHGESWTAAQVAEKKNYCLERTKANYIILRYFFGVSLFILIERFLISFPNLMSVLYAMDNLVFLNKNR